MFRPVIGFSRRIIRWKAGEVNKHSHVNYHHSGFQIQQLTGHVVSKIYHSLIIEPELE